MSMPCIRDRGRIIRALIKIAVIVLCVVLAALIATVGISLYVRLSVEDSVYINTPEIRDVEDFDCVIVLGAGLKSDGTPSPMLEDRIKVGIEVFEASGAAYILMSGDRSGEYYDEPGAMKEYAEKLGVDPSMILTDGCGFSTYESITRVKEEYGFDRVIVITQKYHLYRALYIADKAGIDAIGVSADLRPYMGQTVRDIREILARVKDFFMCI